MLSAKLDTDKFTKGVNMLKKLVESQSVAPMELTGKAWRIKVISEGKGSSAHYPREVLEAQSDIVKAKTRIYLDHPSLDEAENRPERSAKDIIGYFTTDSTYEDGALFAEAQFFSDVQGWVKERAEAGVIGMSIRGSGELEEAEDGSPVLKRFDQIASVDLVTTPGAGGGFEEILEAHREKTQPLEESKETVVMDKEIAEAFDVLRNDMLAKFTELAEALKPVEQVPVVESATAEEIADTLVESGLGKGARARVLAAVKGGADLNEAVKAEQAYVAEIQEATKTEFSANVEEAGGEKVSLSKTIFG